MVIRKGKQVDENAFEIYKMYAAQSESLAERRRAYTAILLPLASALLVGPHFSPDENAQAYFILSVLASLAGIVVSLSWVTISIRYRRIILHRGYWLIIMEHFLHKRQIPRYAQVFTFEYKHLFNRPDANKVSAPDEKNDAMRTSQEKSKLRKSKKSEPAIEPQKPSSSLSEMERAGAITFYFLFLLSPVIAIALGAVKNNVSWKLIVIEGFVWGVVAAISLCALRWPQLFLRAAPLVNALFPKPNYWNFSPLAWAKTELMPGADIEKYKDFRELERELEKHQP